MAHLVTTIIIQVTVCQKNFFLKSAQSDNSKHNNTHIYMRSRDELLIQQVITAKSR